MQLEYIKANVEANYIDIVKKIIKEKENIKHSELQKQYEISGHKVMDPAERKDKIVQSDTGPSTVKVARLPIPMQKKIVRLAAAFLCGNPIELSAAPISDIEKDILSVVVKTWEDNKLDFESKGIAKKMMSETEVAELWYTQQSDLEFWNNTPNANTKFKLRMKVLAKSLGDDLYPVFDNTGDMIAFGRGYFQLEDDKKIEHFDLYTEELIYKGVKTASTFEVTSEANLIGKIPVIYYSQSAPEWADVQNLIDRFEESISNHGDTNDYFGSPMVVVKGEIKGFSRKGEQGKLLELKGDSSANYLSWDQSPESVKLEQENLRSLILDMTDTPDISIQQMKSLGTYSGIALKMIFMGAHLKASDKEEIFGKGIQRRINYIKHAMAKISPKLNNGLSLVIKPKFTYFLPKNDTELVDMLVNATGGGKQIISMDTAIRKNPLVENPEQELEKIKEDMGAAEIIDNEMK